MVQSVRAFASHAEGWVLNPSRDRPKSYKQVVTAPLLNARQQERVTQVLGDDPYKTDVPVYHSRCGSLKNPHRSTAMSVDHWSKFAAFQR